MPIDYSDKYFLEAALTGEAARVKEMLKSGQELIKSNLFYKYLNGRDDLEVLPERILYELPSEMTDMVMNMVQDPNDKMNHDKVFCLMCEEYINQ
jgi:hypothetical protein